MRNQRFGSRQFCSARWGPTDVGPVETVPPPQVGAAVRIRIPTGPGSVNVTHRSAVPVIVSVGLGEFDAFIVVWDRKTILWADLVLGVLGADCLCDRCDGAE